MTKTEAAAVTGIGTIFSGSNIKTFDEFQYFTGVTSIPWRAFEGASQLSSLTIPTSVTSIGRNVFYFPQTSNLRTLIIPASVNTVERNFINKSNLREIYFLGTTPPGPEGVVYTGSASSYPNGTVYIPVGTREAYEPHLTDLASNGWTISDTL